MENILDCEKFAEVRRAALHLLTLLLKGLEKEFDSRDVLREQQEIGPYLRDVRRKLKFLYDTEKDQVAKIHCELAMEELQLIVKKLLTPSTALEYKIRVLDPFD